MSVFDGTFHLQSDQFDRLMAELGAYRGELAQWRGELSEWRKIVVSLPDEAKASIIAALSGAVEQLNRANNFLDRIDISLPSKGK